jgi:glycerate dehydrogenase
MEIIVTDGFALNPGDISWDEVSELGNLKVYDRTEFGEVTDRCRNADIVIINKTPLDAETIQQLTQLKFITMAATGYDCVDIKTAGQRKIPVSNIPVYGTDTVAQYVFSAILHLAHNISGSSGLSVLFK